MCFQSGHDGVCKLDDFLTSAGPAKCCEVKGNFYVNRSYDDALTFTLLVNGSLDKCMPCQNPMPSTITAGKVSIRDLPADT